MTFKVILEFFFFLCSTNFFGDHVARKLCHLMDTMLFYW
ncbi:hypothetical protein KP509_11G096900 [Ceratopteris richardii]|uniref:Uncharacterized protein n=1 Tax=Ceratopteris richardii TaxID=49495 RepID=A0A8T2U0Z4_CERRI|nr:hypothetical protein KP509_11G096900 [Ceratopteris richardii]